jgi:hypothetical protein
MRMLGRWLGAFLAGTLLFGCSRVQEDRGTGAKESVRTFYQDLIRQDWTNAYAILDQHGQKSSSFEEFRRRAQKYRRGLGFEPEVVHIQACQERGPEAIAHVVVTGSRADQSGRFKDAVQLRNRGNGWRIVLSPTFGR